MDSQILSIGRLISKNPTGYVVNWIGTSGNETLDFGPSFQLSSIGEETYFFCCRYIKDGNTSGVSDILDLGIDWGFHKELLDNVISMNSRWKVF